MTAELKASRFNTAIPGADGNDHVLLFNTATRALLKVDAETYGSLAAMFLPGVRGVPSTYAPSIPDGLDLEMLATLETCGFVVPRDEDELAGLRAAFEAHRHTRNLYYTIGLTMACNFDCPYCFEEHRPDHMARETADAVHDFILENATAAHAESLFVNWFGGEPLLNTSVLCHLSDRLKRSAAALEFCYDSLLITNGALLNAKRARLLVEAGVSRAQVTLDGPPEIHDRRRPFKSGQRSFERILENLIEVKDIILLAIRVNVDTGNRSSLPSLMEILKGAGLFEGRNPASLYASPVVPYTEQARMLWQPLAQHELPSLSESVSAGLKQLGAADTERAPSLLVPMRGGCSAMEHHSFVIGPTGHLFKCELGIHDVTEAIGRIGSSVTANKRRRLPMWSARGTKALDWSSYNPFDNVTCASCQFVPICKGGCPKKVLENAEDFMHATCEYWDFHFQRLVRESAATMNRA